MKLHWISRWVSKIIILYEIRTHIKYLMEWSNMLVPDHHSSPRISPDNNDENINVKRKRQRKMVRDAINGFSKFKTQYGLVILDLFIGFDIVPLCRFIVAYNMDINWTFERWTLDIELLLSFATKSVYPVSSIQFLPKFRGIPYILPIINIKPNQFYLFPEWMAGKSPTKYI